MRPRVSPLRRRAPSPPRGNETADPLPGTIPVLRSAAIPRALSLWQSVSGGQRWYAAWDYDPIVPQINPGSNRRVFLRQQIVARRRSAYVTEPAAPWWNMRRRHCGRRHGPIPPLTAPILPFLRGRQLVELHKRVQTRALRAGQGLQQLLLDTRCRQNVARSQPADTAECGAIAASGQVAGRKGSAATAASKPGRSRRPNHTPDSVLASQYPAAQSGANASGAAGSVAKARRWTVAASHASERAGLGAC